MSEETLVSIITPMYNAKRFVALTIESVLAQTYTNWEMIIVDDCSTDDSAAIVKEYSNKDSRVKYFKLEKNSGIAKARNFALEMAKGRYVAFLDSDDIWKPQKLEKQLEFMNENGAHFCHSACDVIREDGTPTGQVRHIPFRVDYKGLLPGDCIACLTVVIDRKYIKDPVMPYIHHEDYAAWLDVLKKYDEVALGLDEVLASYRVSANSKSGNKVKAAKWTWNIYRKYLKLPIVKSCYYFVGYAVKAVLKRM